MVVTLQSLRLYERDITRGSPFRLVTHTRHIRTHKRHSARLMVSHGAGARPASLFLSFSPSVHYTPPSYISFFAFVAPYRCPAAFPVLTFLCWLAWNDIGVVSQRDFFEWTAGSEV